MDQRPASNSSRLNKGQPPKDQLVAFAPPDPPVQESRAKVEFTSEDSRNIVPGKRSFLKLFEKQK
jgi:hypothetical protein